LDEAKYSVANFFSAVNRLGNEIATQGQHTRYRLL